MTHGKKIRVLVVDDSAIVRRVLSETITSERDMEVVGVAPDPYIARDKILELEPDVVTLDIEMPRMDGLTFLEKLMRARPMPVIMISSIAGPSTTVALRALQAGAVDVLAKPGGPYSVGDLKEDLARKIRAAAASGVKRQVETARAPGRKTERSPGTEGLIALGASTGGTVALEQVLTGLPGQMPPIVITQHIPAGFSRAFAERLNQVCALRVMEATDGQALEPGMAVVAPGNYHLTVERVGRVWRARVREGEKVCYQRPAVDVLFQSVATSAGDEAIGALLTGMGNDGAAGLLAMRRAGAYTMAQDEASCVVFGMPKEAIRLGAAVDVVSLTSMAEVLMKRVAERSAAVTRR